MPGTPPATWPVDLADGLAAEASRAGAGIVGGDTARADSVVLSVTALGDLEGRPPVLRSGARPGDVIAVACHLAVRPPGWRCWRPGTHRRRGHFEWRWPGWSPPSCARRPPIPAGPGGGAARGDRDDRRAATASSPTWVMSPPRDGVALDIDSSALVTGGPLLRGGGNAARKIRFIWNNPSGISAVFHRPGVGADRRRRSLAGRRHSPSTVGSALRISRRHRACPPGGPASRPGSDATFGRHTAHRPGGLAALPPTSDLSHSITIDKAVFPKSAEIFRKIKRHAPLVGARNQRLYPPQKPKPHHVLRAYCLEGGRSKRYRYGRR